MDPNTTPTPTKRPRIEQAPLKTSILHADRAAAEALSKTLLGYNQPDKRARLVRHTTEHGFRITFPMLTKDGTVQPCTVFEFHHISNQPFGRRIDYDPRLVSIKEPFAAAARPAASTTAADDARALLNSNPT